MFLFLASVESQFWLRIAMSVVHMLHGVLVNAFFGSAYAFLATSVPRDSSASVCPLILSLYQAMSLDARKLDPIPLKRELGFCAYSMRISLSTGCVIMIYSPFVWICFCTRVIGGVLCFLGELIFWFYYCCVFSVFILFLLVRF